MSLKQPNNSVKVFVKIYKSPHSTQTKLLVSKIDSILLELNKHNIIIKFVNVTPANASLFKKQNIDRTPTLVYANIRKIGVKSILEYLISSIKKRETFAKGASTPEEVVRSYYQRSGIFGKEQEGEAEEFDEKNIRSRMEEFQKKRTQMVGVDKSVKIAGGKPIKIGRGKQSMKFSDDEKGEQEFIDASGINVISTPVQKYEKAEDGDLTLEEYYLTEAETFQGHPKTKPTHRRR